MLTDFSFLSRCTSCLIKLDTAYIAAYSCILFGCLIILDQGDCEGAFYFQIHTSGVNSSVNYILRGGLGKDGGGSGGNGTVTGKACPKGLYGVFCKVALRCFVFFARFFCIFLLFCSAFYTLKSSLRCQFYSHFPLVYSLSIS